MGNVFIFILLNLREEQMSKSTELTVPLACPPSLSSQPQENGLNIFFMLALPSIYKLTSLVLPLLSDKVGKVLQETSQLLCVLFSELHLLAV